VLVNDDIQKSLEDLVAIVRAERLRPPAPDRRHGGFRRGAAEGESLKERLAAPACLSL